MKTSLRNRVSLATYNSSLYLHYFLVLLNDQKSVNTEKVVNSVTGNLTIVQYLPESYGIPSGIAIHPMTYQYHMTSRRKDFPQISSRFSPIKSCNSSLRTSWEALQISHSLPHKSSQARSLVLEHCRQI